MANNIIRRKTKKGFNLNSGKAYIGTNKFALGGGIPNELPDYFNMKKQDTPDITSKSGISNIGGKATAIVGGVTGLVDTFNGNASIADTSDIKSNIVANKAFVSEANTNDDLMSEWGNFSPMQHVTAHDIRGASGGQQAAGVGMGMTSGAAAGATFGPVGAVVGGAAGLLSGIGGIFAGNAKARRAARRLNHKMDIANEVKTSSLENMTSNIDANTDLNMQSNFFAEGGDINNDNMRTQNKGYFNNFFALGGEAQTPQGMTEYNAGGTHEQNPNGGIPIGAGPNGKPNLVEEGEVKFGNYIYSDRTAPDATTLQRAGIAAKYGNHSYADIAERLGKENKERPNDPISKRGLKESMARLREVQEAAKQKAQMEQTQKAIAGMSNEQIAQLGQQAQGQQQPIQQQGQQFAYGGLTLGNDPNNFDLGSNNFIKPTLNNNYAGEDFSYQYPATQLNLDPYSKVSSTVEQPQRTKGFFDNASNLRYAPIVGSGLMAASDALGITNKNNYSNAERIENSVSNLKPVTYNPLGNYEAYKPMDRNFYTNKLNAISAATNRGLINTSGGNRAVAQAGLLASGANSQSKLGDLARQAEEYNLKQRQEVNTFNRGTDQANSSMDLQAQVANQKNDALRTNALAQAAQLREAIRNRGDASRSANITNLFDNMSGVGQEEFNKNAVNSNKALLYESNSDGTSSYKKAIAALKKKNAALAKYKRTHK